MRPDFAVTERKKHLQDVYHFLADTFLHVPRQIFCTVFACYKTIIQSLLQMSCRELECASVDGDVAAGSAAVFAYIVFAPGFNKML